MNNTQSDFVKNLFKKYFGDYQVFVESPGRINLIGEHVDYNGGIVFPAAIDRYIWAAFSKNSDTSVNIIAANLGVRKKFDIKNIDIEDFDSWGLYIIGVIKELLRLNKSISGFNLVFGGNIPIGAGLSSSAALENAIVLGLNQLFDLGLEKKEMIFISQRAEHNYVGVECGIMDQFASMFGQKNKFLFLDTLSLDYELIPFDESCCKIVLVNSNIKHNLASSEYNLRRSQCEQSLRIIQSRFPKVTSLRDVNMSMLDQIKNTMPLEIYFRAKFVVEEMTRVLQAKEALKVNDWTKIGQILLESHRGLRDLYEVSCKELDFLVSKSIDFPGVLGSRMMGAGFGGCTINIVENNAVEEFSIFIREQYQKEFSLFADVYEVNLVEGTHLALEE